MTRTFERAVGNLTALNPITGNADKLTNYLADLVEMNLLHMIAADPARTPTFTCLPILIISSSRAQQTATHPASQNNQDSPGTTEM